MTVVLAAGGLFVHQRLAFTLDRDLDRALRARSSDVAALVAQSDNGLEEAQKSVAIGRRAQLAQILDQRGRVLDQTAGLPRLPVITPTQLARARRETLTVTRTIAGHQRTRLRAAPVRAQDQNLVVIVGQSLAERDRALSDLSEVMFVGAPLVLLLASGAGFLLIGSALRPVERMRRRATTISTAALGGRLPAAGGNDELGRLGRTLNEMLARIEASVVRERTFIADASHELRTPLSMIRIELELIGRDRPAGDALEDAVTRAIEETDRLTALADDLLLLGRVDDREIALKPAPVPAAQLLGEAATRGRRRAERGRSLRVAVDAPDAPTILADRDQLSRALDNMVSNALRYARTEIVLTAVSADGHLELHVLDDGPGFAPEFLAHALERFARGDSARSDEGAGLGLAIVSAIAELHGGNAGVTNRDGGGADVWLALARP